MTGSLRRIVSDLNQSLNGMSHTRIFNMLIELYFPIDIIVRVGEHVNHSHHLILYEH